MMFSLTFHTQSKIKLLSCTKMALYLRLRNGWNGGIHPLQKNIEHKARLECIEDKEIHENDCILVYRNDFLFNTSIAIKGN